MINRQTHEKEFYSATHLPCTGNVFHPTNGPHRMHVTINEHTISHTGYREDGHEHTSPHGQCNTVAQPDCHAQPNTNPDAHEDTDTHPIANPNRDTHPPHSHASPTDRDTRASSAGIYARATCWPRVRLA